MPPRGRASEDAPPARPPEAAVVIAGRGLVRGRLQTVEVGIDEGGTIVQVGRRIRGGERRDFGDAILIPSAVDLHVHTRDPGHEEIEDLSSATLQAAYGGVGLIGEMPNTEPPIDSPDRLESQVSRVAGRSAVDVLVYAVARRSRAIPTLASAAGAFKLYLSPTTGISDPPSDDELVPILESVAASHLALTVHAEAPELFRKGRDPDTLTEWDLARPVTSEQAAIERLLPASPATLRLHVAHVTTAGAADRLREAGQSFECSPHHLLLAAAPTSDTRRKVNPPLRPEPTRRDLWAEFAAGRVPILASDHAPHPEATKDRPFAAAPSGVPGVETMIPLMLERVRAGELPLEVLLATSADRPARWAGVPLGRIAIGHRADLLVVDFREKVRIRSADLHSPCGWTPFEGRAAIFPRHHLRGGEYLIRDGEYVGNRDGRAARPDFATPPTRVR